MDFKNFGIFNAKYETPAERYKQRDKERRFLISPLETKVDSRLNLTWNNASKTPIQKINSNYGMANFIKTMN